MNVPVVSLKFQLEYQWNGQSNEFNGVFLNNLRHLDRGFSHHAVLPGGRRGDRDWQTDKLR